MNGLGEIIFIGLLFIIGIGAFVFGQVVVSAVAFAASALYSNVVLNARLRR